MSVFRKRVLAAVVVLIAALAAALAWTHLQNATSRWFVPYPFPLTVSSRLFDMGVVDVNGDDWLDIYTSNHHFRQALLLADGKGGYRDVLSEWGLDQSREFPEAELSFVAPEPVEAGVYVYWFGTNVVIRTHRTKELGQWKGSLRLNDSIKVVKNDGFAIDLHQQAAEGEETRLDFVPQSDGWLILTPGGQGLPLVFAMSGIAPKQIFVGRKMVSPSMTSFDVSSSASLFTLSMQDRHAHAWADINDDGKLDVFITRGALGGTLRMLAKDIARAIRDELLISRPDGTYEDITASSGIEKKDCSGRHAHWVDFDGHGQLGLFVNCYNRENVPGDYPKQLYRQDDRLHFRDVAAEVGLAIPKEQIGSFAWVDLDNKGLPDLVTFQDEGFFVYRNRGGRFEKETIQLRSLNGAERIGQTEGNEWFFDGKITVADFNGDGYPDLFSASKRGNALIVNNAGKLSVVDPTTVGLPARSFTADWVDYDNDGLPDLFTFPQGLYRQRPDHTFEHTGILEFDPGQYRAALATWFDLDNDGKRDLLLAVDKNPGYKHWWEFFKKTSGAPTPWDIHVFRNVGASNHWLEIRVDGTKGNRQAIGARVRVVTPSGTQTQDVGNAEGAFYSQGHYRLYFGLGPNATADAVRIRWPDGHEREIRNVQGDRLLVVGRDAADGR
jgi:hypothetical protein